ncbi:MAG: PLP-dependent aminotransferase family protein [Deltaproteobacteria bacterium]|nr:PLP-dependent aminotransferase family protein [Deltaproteobacteria bacterium]
MAMTQFRYREIESRIVELIRDKALAPGEKLPSLRAMSRTMKASLSTVGQAYVELEGKGVIQSRPRSGFYVAPVQKLLPRTEAVAETELRPKTVNRVQLIQTVLEVLGDRDLVPLGIISPSPELLPRRLLRSYLREAMDRPEALEYAPVDGLLELRRQICRLSFDAGIAVRPEEIVVTAGAMEALYIALRCVTRPGDTVLIQSPTYFCFLQLVETLGLRAIEVPGHPGRGVDPAEVDKAIRTFDVRACILSPTFNNPDGCLADDEAKAEIVRTVARHGIPLIEDDVSGDLYFNSERPTACKAMDRDGRVMLCSSFSKTVAPGCRLGWLMPGRLADKAREIKATTSVCTASPFQMALAAYLSSGRYPAHLKKLRTAIRDQMAHMQTHLGRSFPAGTRASRPRGGAVLWVELPADVDGVEFFFQARENGISIAPGCIFSTRENYRNYLRLSCSGVWDDRIRDGIETLGTLAGNMPSPRPPRG